MANGDRARKRRRGEDCRFIRKKSRRRNGYRLLDKRFSFSRERSQGNSKPQEMVSDRTLHAIAKKK